MDFHTNHPMVLRSAQRGVLRVSRTFQEALGFGHEELQARPLSDWIHPEDVEDLEAVVRAGRGRARARHLAACGDWVALQWRVTEHDGDTVLLGLLPGAGGVNQSPLSRIAVPETRHTTLGQTLEAMALIVEAKNPGMKCSILLVDADRQIVIGGTGPSLPPEYNAAVEGLRIGPKVGSCGTAAFWNVPVVVEDIARDPLWAELQAAAELAGVAACWSHPITATNGDVLGAMALYADEPSAPARHQMDGLEIAARMVGLEVERIRLEEQLQRAAKMEALGVLAGGIAHDFNNMLAVVLGNAELALTTLAEGDEAAPMLNEIVTASIGATELCNQMLAYAGRGPVAAEVLECNALVNEIGGLLHVAVSKKAALVYELHGEPVGVAGDSAQLRQVLMNLITNASDALGNNAGRIVLGTAVTHFTREELQHHGLDARLAPGEYVRIWVSDTGAGMDAEARERIFDPFFTTKETGRGLGLAAVQGIVQGHGGAIQLESALRQGTTFSVLLPRVALPHAAPTADELVPSKPSRAHVLVVDDEPKVRQILVDILQDAGYLVSQASDGQEAIDLFEAQKEEVDCVLLDLSMPKLDGEEVFHELRKLNPDVRVILSSGYTEREILDRFAGAGLAGVVQKPARMNVLLTQINDALTSPSV